MLIKDQRARNDINGQTDNTILPLLCQHTNYLFSNSVTIMLLLPSNIGLAVGKMFQANRMRTKFTITTLKRKKRLPHKKEVNK